MVLLLNKFSLGVKDATFAKVNTLRHDYNLVQNVASFQVIISKIRSYYGCQAIACYRQERGEISKTKLTNFWS